MGARCMRLAVGLAVVAVVGCSSPRADPSPLEAWPGTVAAIGDSITTAAAPDRDHLSARNPELSWATGGAEVASHRARIAEHRRTVAAENVAVPGARIADVRRQVAQVAAGDPDYVVFLLGVNDLCATDPPTPARFEGEVRRALDHLHDRLPDAYVFVVSLPDVVRLRGLLGDDAGARASWQRTGACPSVLAADRTASDLAAVLDRHARYNRALREACDGQPNCRHDGGVVADHRFSAEEVSSADRFHPSVAGQRRLAELTWTSAFPGAS